MSEAQRWEGRVCPGCGALRAHWTVEVVRGVTPAGLLRILWACDACEALWEGTYVPQGAMVLPQEPEEDAP